MQYHMMDFLICHFFKSAVRSKEIIAAQRKLIIIIEAITELNSQKGEQK